MIAEVGWPEVGLAFIAALPGLIAAIVAALISWNNRTQINDNTIATANIAARVEDVHIATNGMKAQLEKAAYDQGVNDEKKRE